MHRAEKYWDSARKHGVTVRIDPATALVDDPVPFLSRNALKRGRTGVVQLATMQR